MAARLGNRLGNRLELRRARDAGASPRRRISSVADARALLARLHLAPSTVRTLVHAAGSAHGHDALDALARLLWRGTYALVELPPAFRVPPVEQSPVDSEAEPIEPLPAPEPEDGHPPPLVCYEYPRVASYMASGLLAAEQRAERELNEQLFRGLAPAPFDAVPAVYRDMAGDAQLSIGAAAHHATLHIERLMHSGDIPDPTDTVPHVYRELADSKRARIQQAAVNIADGLARFIYAGDTDLAMAEGTLHSNALPPVLRETTDKKVRGVRDSTEGAAMRLDVLLYQGFDE